MVTNDASLRYGAAEREHTAERPSEDETPADSLGPAPIDRGDNEIIRLRAWGSGTLHLLPQRPAAVCTVGTSEASAIRVQGEGASPEWAQLTRRSRGWWIQSLDRETRLRRDGASVDGFILTPGVEIGLGNTILIAESPRVIAVRELCERLLGWQIAPGLIDQVMRSIRLAASHRAALVLRGAGDLVPVARALHRRILGSDAPFVLCDRHLDDKPQSVRTPTRYARGVRAFEAAKGGSLCLRTSALPRDRPALLTRLWEPERRVLVMLCVHRELSELMFAGTAPIQLPPLSTRSIELPAIVAAYVGDAIAALQAPDYCFLDEDLAWVIEHSAETFSDIEKATMRVVAFNASKSLSEAAVRLGMSTPALNHWLQRRAWKRQHREA